MVHPALARPAAARPDDRAAAGRRTWGQRSVASTQRRLRVIPDSRSGGGAVSRPATDYGLAQPIADPHDARVLDDGEYAEAGVVPLGDDTEHGGIRRQLRLGVRRHDAPLGPVDHADDSVSESESRSTQSSSTSPSASPIRSMFGRNRRRSICGAGSCSASHSTDEVVSRCSGAASWWETRSSRATRSSSRCRSLRNASSSRSPAASSPPSGEGHERLPVSDPRAELEEAVKPPEACVRLAASELARPVGHRVQPVADDAAPLELDLTEHFAEQRLHRVTPELNDRYHHDQQRIPLSGHEDWGSGSAIAASRSVTRRSRTRAKIVFPSGSSTIAKRSAGVTSYGAQ